MTSSDKFEAKQEYLQAIHLAESAEKLLVNLDFKRVVLDYYLKGFAIKQTKELINYPVGSSEYNEVVRQLDAISLFDNYLSNLITQGQLAREDLIYLDVSPDDENN